jgi:hypothetical protein
MQDKHTLFIEVFLSCAAVWLSGSFAVEPYDSLLLLIYEDLEKRNTASSTMKELDFQRLAHQAPWYHLVFSFWLFQPVVGRTPSCKPPSLPVLVPTGIREPFVEEQITVARESVAFSCHRSFSG